MNNNNNNNNNINRNEQNMISRTRILTSNINMHQNKSLEYNY